MFKECINNTPFSQQIANEYFTSIDGDDFAYDTSFVSTLRALLAPRLKEGEEVHLNFSRNMRRLPTDISQISQWDVNTIIEPHTVCSGTIAVMDFIGQQGYAQACLDCIEKKFTDKYTEWRLVKDVTRFFHKQFRVLCYIEPRDRRTILFTEELDHRRVHYLQCAIPAFLPWYFKDNPVTEQEIGLLKTLREKNAADYLAYLENMAAKYDFRTMRISKLLTGFETASDRARLESEEERLREYIDEITTLNGRLAETLRAKNQAEDYIFGIRHRIEEKNGEDSEIRDYFLRNKQVELKSVTGTRMTFTARGYLEYFDEDMARTLIDNPNCMFYSGCGIRTISAEDLRKLLTAIFLEQKLKVRTCGAFTFRVGERCDAQAHFAYDHFQYGDCTPNPHLDQYQCMGNYQRAVNEYIQSGDYVMAIEQCVASVRSLAFGDSTVMTEFIERILGKRAGVNMQCIELPDGRVVTPKGAVEYLKEQEPKEEETEKWRNF